VTRTEADELVNDDITGDGVDRICFDAVWKGSDDAMGEGFSTPIVVPDQDRELTRVPMGAGGGGYHYEISVWLSPLRTDGGTIQLAVAWPRLDVPTTITDITVPPHAELQARTQELWP
jgi:hypothetical protein